MKSYGIPVKEAADEVFKNLINFTETKTECSYDKEVYI